MPQQAFGRRGWERNTWEHAANRQGIVRLIVQDTENILLVHVHRNIEQPPEDFLATLQYALQRGIETTYQVEESELSSERIGKDAKRRILIWEAAEAASVFSGV